MPGTDGWQVLHALKTDRLTRDIPVILISIVDQKELGFRLGAADYVVKPFDREALIGSLARVAPDYRRILVIDDDPNVVDLVRQLLEGERCSVDWAPDGAAGLECINQAPPGVILLDLLMPQMDGLAFLFFFKQKTAYEIGLGIPAEPLFRSSRLLTLLVILTMPLFLARLTLIPIKSLSICFRVIRSEERRVGKECRSRWWAYH